MEAHESDLSVASEVTQARVTEALKVGAETGDGLFILTLPDNITPRLRIAIWRSASKSRADHDVSSGTGRRFLDLIAKCFWFDLDAVLASRSCQGFDAAYPIAAR